MKKKFFGLTLLALSFIGFNASAQNPGKTCENGKPCAEQKCDKKGECKGKDQKHCDITASKMFEGITLTEKQKTEIKALCDQQKANKEKASQEFKQNKAKRDSLGKEAKMKMKEGRIAAKKARLADMKKILTPEQYVQFLENNMIYGGQKMQAKKAGKPGFDGKKPGKDMKKSFDKCQKGQKGGKTSKGNKEKK